MLKSVLKASAIGLATFAAFPATAQQGQAFSQGGRPVSTAQTIGAPNTGSVTCFTGQVVQWGPAPAYLIHSAGEALATCPDKKPGGPRVYQAAPRLDPGIRTQVTASSDASAVDASDDTSASSTGRPGNAAGTPQNPSDPLPPSDNGSGIPVLNCSNSSNNPPQVDLSTGQSGWTLNAPSGAVGIAPAGNVSWSAVAGAKWIGPAAPSAIGLYTYTTRVRFNGCPKGRPAQIAVTYRADNIATLFVNGVQSQTQAGTYNYGFLPASQTTKTVVFPTGTSGVQIIELRVQNTSGPTGLAANIQVTR